MAESAYNYATVEAEELKLAYELVRSEMARAKQPLSAEEVAKLVYRIRFLLRYGKEPQDKSLRVRP